LQDNNGHSLFTQLEWLWSRPSNRTLTTQKKHRTLTWAVVTSNLQEKISRKFGNLVGLL
jgi:hypothetical protein